MKKSLLILILFHILDIYLFSQEQSVQEDSSMLISCILSIISVLGLTFIYFNKQSVYKKNIKNK